MRFGRLRGLVNRVILLVLVAVLMAACASAPVKKSEPFAEIGIIQFASGSDQILPESYPVLERVAQIIKEEKIAKLRIEGHASSEGDTVFNRQLSQRRADAVRDFLVAHDVDAGILSAVGLGDERPIADNSTKEGRAKNRRVAFVIEAYLDE